MASLICLLYNTPGGCGDDEQCPFFHVDQKFEEHVKMIRRNVCHTAYTGVCTVSIFGRCYNTCNQFHLSHDKRYTDIVAENTSLKSQLEYLRKYMGECKRETNPIMWFKRWHIFLVNIKKNCTAATRITDAGACAFVVASFAQVFGALVVVTDKVK